MNCVSPWGRKASDTTERLSLSLYINVRTTFALVFLIPPLGSAVLP